MQAKLLAWGSVLLCLCSVANGRAHHADYRQYISTFTVAAFSLVTLYLLPMRERLGAASGVAIDDA